MILDKPSYLSTKITNIIKIHNVIKRLMMNSAGKGPKLPNNPNSQNAKPQNNPLQTDSSQTPLQGFTPQDLTTPIPEFDKFLKTIPTIKYYFELGLKYLLPKLDYLIIETNLLFILFWLMPRMILFLALFIDVFIFYQLHYKYYFVLFGLLLFLNRYLKYSLKNYKNRLIEENKVYISNITTPYVFGIHPAELAPDYDPNDPDEDEYIKTMTLPFEIFIKFQTESIVYQGIKRDIQSIYSHIQLHYDLWEKYLYEPFVNYSYLRKQIPKDYKNIFGEKVPENYNKAQKFIRKKADEYCDQKFKEILQVSLIIEYYNKINNNNKKIKNIKILIYLNYLLCWLYVLIVSIPTLDIHALIEMLQETYLNIENPFY